MEYKKILLAIDFVDKEEQTNKILIEKTQEIAKKMQAEVILVHAVEHVAIYGTEYLAINHVDLEEENFEQAKKSMKECGELYNIPENKRIVKSGRARKVVLGTAKELNVDLIVVGSHGRHGVELLLGSTANAVLHGALCDVLAIRVYE